MVKINYLDLFSGIGGFPLGLQMAGIEFNNHYFSEIDAYAIKVYRKHFPAAIYLGDITRIDGRSLSGIDIFTAGFPCQDISIAGKQAGIDGGIRSGLFYEVIRIAAGCRPGIIFLENVSNLLSINGGSDFGTVLRELASIGYDAEWHCVPASHVGAPHRRDRIWIMAYPTVRENNGRERRVMEQKEIVGKGFNATIDACGEDVANATGERRGEAGGHIERSAERTSGSGEVLADTESKRLEGQRSKPGKQTQPKPGDGGAYAPNATRKRLRGWESEDYSRNESENQQKWREAWSETGGYLRQWSTEPNLGMLAHGLSAGLDVAGMGEEPIRVAKKVLERTNQLKALGNAVVPQVVAYLTELIVKPLLRGPNEKN